MKSPRAFGRLVGLAGLAMISGGFSQPVPDVTVKAAFVARFAEFVQWPPPGRINSEPLFVCLSPAHPFGTRVAESVGAAGQSRQIRVRTLDWRELRNRDEIEGCNVLYVAPADASLLLRAQRQPILTIGDQADFYQRGGIINFRVVDRRVRFEVDLAQARQVGLTLDSQLLRLAAVVHGGRS